MVSVRLQLEDAGRAWSIQRACEQNMRDPRTLEKPVELRQYSDATNPSGSTGHG
jgi:hypothetical protein